MFTPELSSAFSSLQNNALTYAEKLNSPEGLYSSTGSCAANIQVGYLQGIISMLLEKASEEDKKTTMRFLNNGLSRNLF